MLQVINFSRNVIKLLKPLPSPVAEFLFRVYDNILRIFVGNKKIYKVKTRYGPSINCNTDDVIQKYIFYFGVWEPAISKLMNKILRAGDVCVDIGANIGYDSLLAAQCVGKSGSVIAIEASPAIYKLLNVNIKQNEMSQIRSVNLAASNFSGDISLYYGGDQNIGATTTVKSRGFPGVGVIKALPVIDILSNDEMSRARLIKIDIEGGELPVLDNIITNIDRFSNEINLIVEASAHEDEIGWANITNRFLARGFKLYEIENSYEVTWYLQNHQEYKLNSLDKMPSRQVDILFTRTNLEEFQLLF